MITKWGVKNFKSILEADLDLAPLTIFTGVNNSGKSSFLHSIAMLKQSVNDNPVCLDQLYGLVALNGKIVNLYFWDSVLCYKAANHPLDDIWINFTIKKDKNQVNVKMRCGDEMGIDIDTEGLVVKSLYLEYNNREDTPYIKCQVLPEFEYKDDKNKITLCRVLCESGFDNLKENEVVINFLEKNFVPEEITTLNKNINSEEINGKLKIIKEYFLSNIKYLFPLRKEPKWEYKKIPYMEDIDVKGRNTIAFLKSKLDNKYEVENYISPKDIGTVNYLQKSKVSLENALKDCLICLGVCTDLKIKPNVSNDTFYPKGSGLAYDSAKQRKGFNIYLIIDGKEFALKQLGTGVSQVLPILVMCLAAPVGSTIVIQEPEQGLHPKMQSRLADFFIAMALSGRQCIIETHSEYLIYMIRYRISQSLLRNDESIQKAIRLLYAEKENGVAKFHEIKVNRYGELSDWPNGFFDERQKMSDMMLEGIISEIDI